MIRAGPAPAFPATAQANPPGSGRRGARCESMRCALHGGDLRIEQARDAPTHPFRDVAIAGVAQHGASPGPAGPRLDVHRPPRSDGSTGRRRHLAPRRRRRRRDGLRADRPRAGARPVHQTAQRHGDPGPPRCRGPHHHRPVQRRADRRRWCRRPLGPFLDGALDPAGQRARRRLRAVHRSRIRAHGAASHADLRHHARADGHRRGRDPHQWPRQPRCGLLRTRTFHARRHPGLAHDRRPVPSPRLRHDLGGWLRHRPDHGGARRGVRGARLHPRRRQRRLRARLRRGPGLGLPAPRRLLPGRARGRAGGPRRLCHGRPLTPRCRRGRALRSVLVRDHQAARSLRLLPTR